GEEGVVAAHADVVAGPELGAALTHEDVAGDHGFAAELLHAEAAARGVAPVARGAARFLVSHCALLNSLRTPYSASLSFLAAAFFGGAFLASPSPSALAAFGAAAFFGLAALASVLAGAFTSSAAAVSAWAVAFFGVAFLGAASAAAGAAAGASAVRPGILRPRARASSTALGVRSTLPSHLADLPSPSMAVTRSTDSSCRWPRVRR